MTCRRALVLDFAATALVIVTIALTPPVSTILYFAVFEQMSPERVSWDGKSAWKRCDSAIAGQTAWPPTPAQACAAMHMCANEAALSPQQMQMLEAAIRATPGCPSP